MQIAWLIRGLRTGVVTTRYPREPETLPRGFRGLPVLDVDRCHAADGCNDCVQACLPRAITLDAETRGQGDTGRESFAVSEEAGGGVLLRLNYGACIMCGLCVAACQSTAITMTADYELAVRQPGDLICAATLRDQGAHHESTASPEPN